MKDNDPEMEALIGYLAEIHRNGTDGSRELHAHLPERFLQRIAGVDTSVPVEVEVKPRNDWPAPLADAAYYGSAGKFVQAISPLTEADPAALLLHYLAYTGILLGRKSRALIGMDEHPARHNVLIIGPTGSGGRKGTSETPNRELIKRVDPLMGSRIKSGLVSGEGIVWVIRDPKRNADDEEYEEDVSDDKRLITIETEFASLLQVIKRSSNTTSATIRAAWDGKPLETLAKNKPARCAEPHVAVIGHITPDELKGLADNIDINNGLLNRFIWCAAKRSKLLPRGHAIPPATFNTLVTALADVLGWARQHAGEVTLSPEAEGLWIEWYTGWMATPRQGLVAAALGRLDAITLRLAVSYALLDMSMAILPEHLYAARAVAEYHERTVEWLLVERSGNRQADDVLAEVELAGGMTRTEIHNFLGRNLSRESIDTIRDLLLATGKIRVTRTPGAGGKGRRQEVWQMARQP